MFVPRQIQKKTTSSKRLTPASTSSAPPKPQQPPPVIETKKTETERCDNDRMDPMVARETVMALEMMLSDFSMEHVQGDWLRERMRELEGRDDFIHLSTFVDCRFLERMKPKLSQVSFMKALVAHESNVLELSADKYHVRRRTGLSPGKINPDECTIYIEPHITNITPNPGRVARILSETQLPRKYLPVQFVESQDRSWALVTLSSEILQVDAQNKKIWPKDWIVMTKSEWRRRDAEYKELRRTAQRVPAFYRPSSCQESAWQEKDPRPEKVDFKISKINTSQDPICLRGEEKGASDFKLGLIVRLTNLNTSTTKGIINSFVSRSVDRYLRRKGRNKRGKNREENTTKGKSVAINYVDYEKGLGQAYIRQSSKDDSELIIKALKKRKRTMRDGEDTKGEKATEHDWVGGNILAGEEEKFYWEKLLSAKNTKGKGKGKRGWKDQSVLPGPNMGYKRSSGDSEASNSHIGKRTRLI